MKHFYAIVPSDAKTTAEAKGRSTYQNPPDNVSRRYSLDGKTLLVEGLFSNADYDWFCKNGTVFADAESCREYIAKNRAEWEAPEEEIISR